MFRRSLVLASVVAIAVLAVVVSAVGLVGAQDAAQPYLGITLQPSDKGVQVEQVMPDSPADKAGLKTGDIITAVDGKSVTAQDIADAIKGYSTGDTVKLSVERGSDTVELSAILAARPAETPNIQVAPSLNADRPMLGVRLEDSDNGVVIREVVANSPAEKAGLKVDDILEKIGDTTIDNAASASTAIQTYKAGDKVSIQVKRGDESVTVDATLEAATNMPQIQIPFGQFNQGEGLTYNANDKTWTINALSEDNALYKAGLREGDVVKEFDGKTYDPAGLTAYLKDLDKAQEIKLTIERDGASQEITVKADDLSSINAFSFDFGNGQMPFGLPFGFGQPMNGRLGVEFVSLDEQTAKEHNVQTQEGALVTDVTADSPASTAGLKINDVITAVDGEKVDAEHTLRDRLMAYEAGDEVKLDVIRDGKTMSLTATLDQPSMSDFMPNFDFGQNGIPFMNPQQPMPNTTQPNL